MKFDLDLDITAATPVSRLESDDAYQPVVARLNDGWRVIVCRDRIQWILQKAKKSGHGTEWRGRSCCRTREALLRVCVQLSGGISPGSKTVLEAPPPMVGNGGEK